MGFTQKSAEQFFGLISENKIELLIDVRSVSYTHLDVYKRQINSSCFCVPFSLQISEILPERKSCRLAPRICVQKSSFIFGVIMKQRLLPSGTYHHILQGMGLLPAVYKCHIR